MKKEKISHKQQYVDSEASYIQEVEKQKEKDQKALNYQRQIFDKKLQELVQKYENRLKKLRDDLELKMKVEIHELEERKNLHINELMNNHDKAFAELKKYYNDITAENLNLIKNQKEEIARIHARIQKNSKIKSEMEE